MVYEEVFFGALAVLLVLSFEGFRVVDRARDKQETLMSEINALEEEIRPENVTAWFDRLTAIRQPVRALKVSIGSSLGVMALSAIGIAFPDSARYVFVGDTGSALPALNLILGLFVVFWLVMVGSILAPYYGWVFKKEEPG